MRSSLPYWEYMEVSNLGPLQHHKSDNLVCGVCNGIWVPTPSYTHRKKPRFPHCVCTCSEAWQSQNQNLYPGSPRQRLKNGKSPSKHGLHLLCMDLRTKYRENCSMRKTCSISLNPPAGWLNFLRWRWKSRPDALFQQYWFVCI